MRVLFGDRLHTFYNEEDGCIEIETTTGDVSLSLVQAKKFIRELSSAVQEMDDQENSVLKHC